MNFLNEMREIIRTNIQDFFATDWSIVQFKQEYFATRAAAVIMAVLFTAILWKRWRRRRKPLRSAESQLAHSGYWIGRGSATTFFDKFLGSISITCFLSGAALVFVALADPYIVQSLKTDYEESREIGWLKDVSASMGLRYKNSDKSRAEIVQDFVLDLVASRRDKNDRSFYAVFSSAAYLVADFTTKNDSLLFYIAGGPMVIADPSAPDQPLLKGKFIIKDFDKKDFEGGTDLALGLNAVLGVFDKNGDKKITEEIKRSPSIKKRSVVIITDGASETDPEPNLKELQKRSIVPYLIFIDPDREVAGNSSQGTERLAAVDNLFSQIKKYGGESFLATDRTALSKIPARLNELHASVTGTRRYADEQHIYRLPLMAAIQLFMLGLLCRIILWKYHKII
ncbi:MAG: VWA domain-containing protein [Candidatus Yanofskybacteria bacterium]|nr:VWA domain-containing protein [Candidatus Yanofskybacteria bacterium]